MKREFIEQLNMLTQSRTFEPIDLESIGKLSLPVRFDTKFLIGASHALDIIETVKQAYFILDVDGLRIQNYDSFYFDNPEMRSYNEHLRSKNRRFKIRKRSYTASGIHFLEIKQKENTGRTNKIRMPIREFSPILSADQHEFLQKHGYKSNQLKSKVRVSFNRLTLASKLREERVTIDFGLECERNEKKYTWPYLSIIEVKQNKKNRKSSFLDELKSKVVRPESFSKYCLSMSMVEPTLKSNMYKEKILKINKMKTEYGILSNTDL